jgi:hypothetical protein
MREIISKPTCALLQAEIKAEYPILKLSDPCPICYEKIGFHSKTRDEYIGIISQQTFSAAGIKGFSGRSLRIYSFIILVLCIFVLVLSNVLISNPTLWKIIDYKIHNNILSHNIKNTTVEKSIRSNIDHLNPISQQPELVHQIERIQKQQVLQHHQFEEQRNREKELQLKLKSKKTKLDKNSNNPESIESQESIIQPKHSTTFDVKPTRLSKNQEEKISNAQNRMAKNSKKFTRWQTVRPLLLQRESLSITSIHFNPDRKISLWIDRTFGSRAHVVSIRNIHDTPFEELVNSTYTYAHLQKSEILPNEFEKFSRCSLEVLGYVRLNTASPLLTKNRLKPMFGRGSIQFENYEWKCYYRVTIGYYSEVWTTGYWPVLFYCPSPIDSSAEKQCLKLDESGIHKYNLNFIISMQLSETIWTNKFEGALRHAVYVANDRNKLPNKALCIATPYATSDEEKMVANGAMLAEFVNYYSKLGFRVFLYDRGGSHREHLFDSDYIIKRNLTLDFEYFDYTIRGLLENEAWSNKYDNMIFEDDKFAIQKRDEQDLDKTLTLTHCRFELKSAYQIETVLILDYDEFLFVPGVSSLSNLRQNMDKLINIAKLEGVEQSMFLQRWVAPKELPPRNCLMQQAKNGSSIFDCFGPYRFLAGNMQEKSLHLKHACPVTDYHYACSHAGYNYNCNCESAVHWGWELIHLTSSSNYYDRRLISQFSDAEKQIIQNENLELSAMTQIR